MRIDSSSFCLFGSGSSGRGGASSGGGGGGIPWGIGGGGTIDIPGWDIGWGTKGRGAPIGVNCDPGGGGIVRVCELIAIDGGIGGRLTMRFC